MNRNNVKRTLDQGGVALGTMMFEFDTTGIARILAAAGTEFAIFDMEHTGWSVETIRMLMATSRSADLVPIVRVPATEYHFLARVLDVGAMGVMVPMVETEEQAQFIVQSAKYPPDGRRGAAFGIAHDDYQGGGVDEKIRNANNEQLLIAQIETASGLENVDRIAAVDGVDILWIGQFDLTNSLGIPAQFDHPQFQQAIQRVVEACNRHGKVPGIMALNIQEAQQRLGQGFRCLAYSGDLWIFQESLKRGLEELRGHLE